jgi:proprotein convertase subtilisin/kexin type 5
MSGGTCVSTCPSMSYFNTSSGSCQSCSSDCLQCFGGSSTQCLSCNSSLLFYDNQCVPSCPDGYYAQSGSCQCNPTFQNETKQQQQQKKKQKKNKTNKQQFKIPNNLACNLSCNTCTGNSTSCLSCLSGYVLDQSACYSSCPMADQYVDSSQTCQCKPLLSFFAVIFLLFIFNFLILSSL